MKEQDPKKQEQSEKTGEDLLQEYFEQDKDDKHQMGYGVYGQTSGGDCCC